MVYCTVLLYGTLLLYCMVLWGILLHRTVYVLIWSTVPISISISIRYTAPYYILHLLMSTTST